MPGFNGTGPQGMGPMTGGARGFCNPYNQPFVRRDSTFRSGIGRGRGRGFRNMFWATGVPGWARYDTGGYRGLPHYDQYSREQEIGFLKDQSTILKEELSSIDNRLRELESQDKQGKAVD
jgi:hypothetical protein